MARKSVLTLWIVGGAALSAILMQAAHKSNATAILATGVENVQYTINGVNISAARGYKGESAKYERILAAYTKFPTYDSCVIRSNQAFQRVDWTRVDSDIEAAVCIARVVHELKSIESTVVWLRRSGFVVNQVRRGSSTDVKHMDNESNEYIIEALWPIQSNGALTRGSLLASLLQRVFGWHVSVVIEMNTNLSYVKVNCTTTTQ